MKILITGNMGYVGSTAVRHLRRRHPHATLIGFDAGWFAHALSGAERLPESLLDAQYFGDVREFPPELLDGVDTVVQLAAVSNDPMGQAFEALTDEINHRAVVKIATIARERGVRRCVFASSCSMYGFAENGARRECDPLNPLTAYARSKVAAEQGLEALANDSFTVSALRFATACGSSDRLRLDLVLNDFVAGAVSGGRIDILSDGTPWRPLITTADMARAIDWAITRDSAAGGPFVAVNAGSNGWNHQVRALAEAVAAAVPGTSVSINPEAPPDKRSYRVSFDRFAELAPEHQPETSLDQAIASLRDQLRLDAFADTDFRNGRFIRLHSLRVHRESGRMNDELYWI